MGEALIVRKGGGGGAKPVGEATVKRSSDTQIVITPPAGLETNKIYRFVLKISGVNQSTSKSNLRAHIEFYLFTTNGTAWWTINNSASVAVWDSSNAPVQVNNQEYLYVFAGGATTANVYSYQGGASTTYGLRFTTAAKYESALVYEASYDD